MTSREAFALADVVPRPHSYSTARVDLRPATPFVAPLFAVAAS